VLGSCLLLLLALTQPLSNKAHVVGAHL
jgi:hypothetical protein